MVEAIKPQFYVGRDPIGESVVIGHSASENPALKINKDGIVTEPYKPFFSACLSQTLHNQTINAQFARFIPDFIHANVGEYYNQTSGQFTAPVDGVYFLNARVSLTNLPDIKTNSILAILIGTTKYEKWESSYDSLRKTMHLFVTEFMKQGTIAWVEVSAAVQSLTTNQAVGFGGDPVLCNSGISGGLM